MNGIKRTLSQAEAGILDSVAAIVPWLTPTPTAYIAYDHLYHVLALPFEISVAGALVVEGLGLSVVHTALGFWRADGLRSWRLWLAITAGIFYLTVVTSVNVLLDRSAPVETLAKSLLSFTSVPAALILALRYQDKAAAERRREAADLAASESVRAAQAQAEREAREAAAAAERLAWEREQEQLRLEAERTERLERLRLGHEFRLARLQANATDALRATALGASVAPVANGASKHDATLQQFVADHPKATPSEIERATGINRGTVSRWLKRNADARPATVAGLVHPVHPNGVAKEAV